MIAAISLKVGAPHLVLLRSSLFSVKKKMKNFSPYKTIENCAAGIADTVQRGLGMLPQQAICKDWPRGKIEKMSEPVQVHTACQFVSVSEYAVIPRIELIIQVFDILFIQ